MNTARFFYVLIGRLHKFCLKSVYKPSDPSAFCRNSEMRVSVNTLSEMRDHAENACICLSMRESWLYQSYACNQISHHAVQSAGYVVCVKGRSHGHWTHAHWTLWRKRFSPF